MKQKLAIMALAALIAIVTTGCKTLTSGTMRNNGTVDSTVNGKVTVVLKDSHVHASAGHPAIVINVGNDADQDSDKAEQGGAALEADVQDAGNTSSGQ